MGKHPPKLTQLARLGRAATALAIGAVTAVAGRVAAEATKKGPRRGVSGPGELRRGLGVRLIGGSGTLLGGHRTRSMKMGCRWTRSGVP